MTKLTRRIPLWISANHLFLTTYLLHDLTVSYTNGRTEVFSSPICFGLTSPDRFDYKEIVKPLTYETAAITIHSSGQGLQLDTSQMQATTTCVIEFRISINRIVDTLFVFFNHASISQTSNQSTSPILISFWFYFYREGSRERMTLYRTTMENQSNSLFLQPLNTKPWPIGLKSFYLTLETNNTGYASFRLRFSVTITPIFRCHLLDTEKTKQQTKTNQISLYKTGFIICAKSSSSRRVRYAQCVPRDLYCDSHVNCPTTIMDEPSDRTICMASITGRKVDVELVLGVLSVILTLLVIFAMVFTLTDCRLLCKRARSRCAPQNDSSSLDDRSTTTEYSLPVAPPRYESVEQMGLNRKSLCKLCPAPNAATMKLDYESPPSYTRDMLDETGVYPVFIRPLHKRPRFRGITIPRGRNAIVRRTPTRITEGQSEETRSIDSWTASSFGHPDPATRSSNDLPNYRDLDTTRNFPTSERH